MNFLLFFNDINHGYRAVILKKNSLWLLPFYMAVATYFYYEKVRRTMRNAIISYFLKETILLLFSSIQVSVKDPCHFHIFLTVNSVVLGILFISCVNLICFLHWKSSATNYKYKAISSILNQECLKKAQVIFIPES